MKNHEQLTIKYLDKQKREDRQAYALPRCLSRQSTCLVSVKSERRTGGVPSCSVVQQPVQLSSSEPGH